MDLNNLSKDITDRVMTEEDKRKQTDEKVRAILTDLYLWAAEYTDENPSPEKAKEAVGLYLLQRVNRRPYAEA